MGKIIVLDEGTANKIAAGEVIERPASVVKELVENSIDAGAANITVELKNGGISYIKVTDNGSGISEDDAVIAFERHATSKIKSSADLDSIATLGFRGEALASIAAVANLQLVTRTLNSTHGMRVEISGGILKDVKQTGCPVGTTFIIRDLFFNTPARYKFLKKDASEAGQISDIIERIALGNPHISFHLTSNNSTVLHTPGNGDLLSTIYSIYGKDVASSSLEIAYTDNKIKLEGYAGKPEISRSNRNFQSFYLNGRYIKSRMLSSAVEEAYGTLLMKNRHAFIVMSMQINPLLVDVNVHPSKMEVRFSNEQDIFRSIYHAVNNSLTQKPLIREMQFNERKISGYNIPTRKYPDTETEYKQQKLELNSFIYETAADRAEEARQLSADRTEVASKLTAECATGAENKCNTEKLPEPSVHSFSEARIIGQAFSTYIILEQDDELILIDQHAAHERILYEKLKAAFERNEPMSQLLLTPVVLELTNQEIRKLEESVNFFSKLGFTYDNFGNNSIVLRSVPYTDSGIRAKEAFLEVLDRILASDLKNQETDADEALYTYACKAAVKGNHKLDDTEIKAVLKELGFMENPYSCPHGRPTAVRISKYEFEKNFKRIV